jgi:hypothetical protein
MKYAVRMIATVAVIVISGFAFYAAAQDSEGSWIKDQNGCKHFNPNPQAGEKLTWSGACKDGVGDGDGEIEWFLDGKLVERYEGAYKAGKPAGKGTLVSTQNGGYRYEGEWVDGGPKMGKMSLPDGTIYIGEFKDWKFNGKGELTLPDGSTQYGNWIDGELAQPLEKM